jgi:peptidoglycan hydrolase-like protein with peptidoglycan-binding domain/SH3-like domain-containing protein
MLSVFTPYAQAADYPYTSLTNDKVNMRRSANGDSVVLERLEANTQITVLGESGKYFKVSYNDRTGYILKQYIGDKAEATATATPKPNVSASTVSGYPYQTTTKDSVNMRKSASTDSVVLEKLPMGAELTVEGESGKYLKVRYNGTSGYVIAEFIYVRTVATSTPPPSSNANSDYNTLEKGDSGKEVKALQQVLIELKYLSGIADGKFGGQTETAVKNCQNKNKLPETGTADAMLQALLYEDRPRNADGDTVRAMTLPPIDDVTIREGNIGDAVAKMQERLSELRYYTGAVSGVCSKDTVAAVTAFQEKNGLKADGLAGSATQSKMFSDDALPKGAIVVTPAPTSSTPIATPPGVTVRQGDEGTAAKAVQKRLKELGYLSGSADGKFGNASVTALIAFQKRHGLTQDGVAGTATQNLLFSSAALPSAGEVTPIPTSTPLTEDNVIVIQRGTKGVQVLNLQKRLTELGYYTAKMDSDYETADIAAVKAFQKNNGLKADGIAGYETQVLMFSDRAVPGSNVTPSPTPAPTPTPDLSTLKQGSTGNEVKSLQQRLYQLGYLSGNADGNFGSNTAMAVLAFQKANGLGQDGVAGPTTLSKLYSTSASPNPTASPSPTPALLKQGDSSDTVKSMQMTLIDLGYLSGKADGVFGSQTFLALKAFQSNNGLPSDGVAGEKTLNVLGSSTAKPAPTVPGATATPKPTAPPVNTAPTASQVRYANWYTEIRARCRTYPYATVYDYNTGLSWKVHMFSIGAHADSEPVSAADTAIMVQAFGGKYTWTPKSVWVVMSDGRVYMASTHDNPHGVDHNTSNNFPGHLCIHFPRTQAEVTAIGDYATSHQAAIDLGWKATQNKIN